jgi:hypothetical protein
MQRRDESRQSRSPRTTTAFYGIQFVTRSIDQFPQADLGTNLVCCPNQLLISWQNSVVCIIATIWLPEHPLETLLVEVEDGQMERCACRPCLVRFVMFSMCSAVSERPVPNRKPLPKRPSSSQSRSSLRPDVVLARDRHEKCPRFHEGIFHPLACELLCLGDRQFSGPACDEPRQPDRAIRYPAAEASWAPA